MANSESADISQLDKTFDRAADHLQSLASQLDSGQLLGFYGLYKQATVGPCDTPRPSWYQTQAKHKWEAWKALGDMGKEVAMGSYIRAVGKLDPTWEKDARLGSQAWVTVSRLPNTDVELRDIDKTLLDWVKDGDEEKVRDIIARDRKSINVSDDSGMLPIHWASDRGYMPTIKCLVENGAEVNARDNEGQTALHYAASCGHAEVVKYLLSVGAQCVKDNDGMTPKDVADEQIAALL
ncbi:acyl-CoA-binding domain-containing protein 6 [Neodiprion pinetum]|uniref:Acyl-CoA-binding domain-containing protein 6 n=1 Tax=Neodiprion lecontei TaxID=441921 RepID=A0A6J0BB51_NEOLC|nr:acyl-CoA-binding domain-containing protein 6 [Neodiprion lecontei]XP_046413090.1 acyl-CoA-binding domain-containing protein 6-like [Neodiprion fabricii]XP_046468196.1 acyl-CoA-binding domain-containing protein 6-like [Neodiprion pinetum]XP_046604225.1 acyl-CoA-binding domain-containing protein 6-like [Neodiprion virginianus]